jgi:VWFA-related protein
MKLRRFFLPLALAGVLLSLAPQLRSQQPQQTAQPKNPATPDQASPRTLSVDARLINIPVVVRDKKGARNPNLTKADFTLQVDGHPQTIRYFDRDANLPLTLGLLVDTSASQRDNLDDERTAAGTFLDQMLTTPSDRQPDKAFVLQFARQVELLQDLTSSHPRLQSALTELGTPSSNDRNSTDSNDNSDNNRNRRITQADNTLYDATFLASDEIMAKQKGRKALVILSNGVDRNSKENITKAIEAAQRSDTVIYAIYFKGEEPRRNENRPRTTGGIGNPGGGGYPGGGYPGGGYPGGGYPGGGYPGGGYPGGGYPGGGYPGGGGTTPSTPSAPRTDGRKILERMAQETGGRLFEASKKLTASQIFTQIAEELRAQYRLGCTPDSAASSDGYHQIDLTLSQPDMQKKLTIQTRDGYYAGK